MPAASLEAARNTLTECPQDESYEVTTRLDASKLRPGDRAGLSLFDRSTSFIAITPAEAGTRHTTIVVSAKGKDLASANLASADLVSARTVLLRATVHKDTVTYAWSSDNGRHFQTLGDPLPLVFSWWKGARPALFAFHTGDTAPAGFADFDFLHYRPLPTTP
jgi:beta-xylosidase